MKRLFTWFKSFFSKPSSVAEAMRTAMAGAIVGGIVGVLATSVYDPGYAAGRKLHSWWSGGDPRDKSAREHGWANAQEYDDTVARINALNARSKQLREAIDS